MGKRPMAPMAVSERAKQFMPFKAVLGLDEALTRKRMEMGVPEGEECLPEADRPMGNASVAGDPIEESISHAREE